MIAARPVVVTLSPGSDHGVVLQKQTVTGSHEFRFSVVPGVYYVKVQPGWNDARVRECRSERWNDKFATHLRIERPAGERSVGRSDDAVDLRHGR